MSKQESHDSQKDQTKQIPKEELTNLKDLEAKGEKVKGGFNPQPDPPARKPSGP